MCQINSAVLLSGAPVRSQGRRGWDSDMSWVSSRRSASVLHEAAITISLEKDQRFVIPGCRYGEEVAARKLEK